jgi:3-hydroxybutyryl-CoA dehydrogenase
MEQEQGMTTLGVVGGGTMGGGIVQVAAQQGLDVILWDVKDEYLAGSISRIRTAYQRSVERGRMSQEEADAAIGRIRTTTEFADFAAVDATIEAVLEDKATKTRVFQQLDEHCPPHAIMATNTSSLSVTEIGAVTKRPGSVVGMHFFNPVPAMALVEVIQGVATSDETMDRGVALGRELGKTPVRAQDTPGFVVNRIVRPFYNEGLRLLNDGAASFQEIDRIMKGRGFRMGPFQLMDLIGNDVNFAVTTLIFEQLYGEPRIRPSFRQERMVQSGQLGQKTKHGWYDYE